MDEEKEREGGVAGNTADPRLYDPPKPVVVAEESSPLAAKIAKLSENLSTTGALSAGAGSARTAAPPALITSGSLDEARAYLPHVEPSRSDDPITIEMRRVRIAEEVNVATWVTEKVDKGRLASVNGVAGAARSIDGVDNDRAHEKVVGDFEAPGRGRGARRAALWGGLALGATVLVVGFVLVDRADLGGRLARNEPAVQVAHAGSYAWLEDLQKAAYQARSTSAEPVVLAGAAPTPDRKVASRAVAPIPQPVSSTHERFTSPSSVVRPHSPGAPLNNTNAPGSKRVQPRTPPVEQEEPAMAPELMMK